MRHLEGRKLLLGGRQQVLAVSGVAVLASLGSIYAIAPGSGRQTLQKSSQVVISTDISNQAQIREPEIESSPSTRSETPTELTINDQEIALPQQGSIHKTLPNKNGQTAIDVSVDHQTTPRGGSSSMRLNISSHNSSYSHSESVGYEDHSPPF